MDATERGERTGLGDHTAPIQRFCIHVDGIAYGLSPFGGLIRYWNELLATLIARGHQVRLDLPQALRADPIPIPAVEREPDLFTSTYFTVDESDLPTVVVVHDMIYEEYGELSSAPDLQDTIERKRIAVADATAIVVPSVATAAAVHRHYGATPNVTVIPYGISEIFTPATPISGRSDRSRLDRFVLDRPYLLHVGGRDGHKGFVDIAAAYLSEPRLNANFDLVIAGSQSDLLAEEREILGIPSKPSTLKLLGHVKDDDLAALYRSAAAVVSGSHVEGFGFCVLEATACGTPVACSPIPTHLETLGDRADYFAARQPAAIADAIIAAVDTPPDTRQNRADHVKSMFHWNATASALEGVYASVIDRV